MMASANSLRSWIEREYCASRNLHNDYLIDRQLPTHASFIPVSNRSMPPNRTAARPKPWGRSSIAARSTWAIAIRR